MRSWLPDQAYADEARAQEVLRSLSSRYGPSADPRSAPYVLAVCLSASGEVISMWGSALASMVSRLVTRSPRPIRKNLQVWSCQASRGLTVRCPRTAKSRFRQRWQTTLGATQGIETHDPQP